MAIQRRPAHSRAGGLLLPLLGAVLVLGVLAISKWEGAWVSRRTVEQLQVGPHAARHRHPADPPLGGPQRQAHQQVLRSLNAQLTRG